MAIKRGIQYFWDTTTNEWVEFYPKASLALMEETASRKIFTVGEQTKIADYLTTFNTANKLVRLNASGKFTSDLMTVNDDIDMAGNTITGIYGLYFSGQTSSIYTDTNEFVIQTSKDLLKIISADTVRIGAADLEVTGSMSVAGSLVAYNDISLIGAVNRAINGVNTINFVDSTGDVNIAAVQSGGEYELDFTWGDGSRNLNLAGNVANFNGTRLTGLLTPSDATDAATKQWVEQLIAQGTHVVAAARVATTIPVVINDTGLITSIDGVTLAEGDRVLVWQQTNAAENGVYRVNASPQKWTKIDIDSDKGSLIFVTEGDTNKGKQFYNTNGDDWELFFTQDTYFATDNRGLELDLTGFGFGIKNLGVTNAMLAGSISADKILKTGAIVANGNSLAIATGGIINTMLAGNIDWSKLDNTAASDGLSGWGNLSDASVAQPLLTKINQLFSAVKLLRGTTNYNTNAAPFNAQTIAGAYTAASDANTQATGRSKVFYRAAAESLPTIAEVGTLTGGVTAVCYKEYSE